MVKNLVSKYFQDDAILLKEFGIFLWHGSK